MEDKKANELPKTYPANRNTAPAFFPSDRARLAREVNALTDAGTMISPQVVIIPASAPRSPRPGMRPGADDDLYG